MVLVVFGSVLLTFFQVFSTAKCYQYDCTRAEYNRCVKIADPLIKVPQLVFPDNRDDIDSVCRTWHMFIDCLRPYIEKCFSPEQRRQFNNAVKNSIDSVHEMCINPGYQEEYLVHARCIKSTITDSKHCGQQYSLLVDQVAQGDDISRAALCCSHDRFKKCIESETRNLCDKGMLEGPASKFSTQIIEKALSFLQEECFSYIPNSGDCSESSKKENRNHIDSLTSPSSSEVYPWNTIQEAAGREQRTKIQPSKTTTAWLPSSTYYHPASDPGSPATDILDSRTRPASYGRSNGWTDYSVQNTQPGINNVYPETPTSQKPEWATSSNWHVLNQQPGSLTGTSTSDNDVYKGFSPGRTLESGSASSTTWFPAGDQLENEVEEPNTQGWIKPRNGAQMSNISQLCVIFITVALLIC